MTTRLLARPCPPPDARFWAKVDKNGPGGCWLWTAATDLGYGRLNRGGKVYRAHRIAFVHAYGEPDPKLVIDHLCRVRHCVNPMHLEAVQMAENVMRGDSPSVAHSLAEKCPFDHPYTPENTYQRPDGARVCRTCKRTQRREEKQRARTRKRLGLGPGRPGKPKTQAAQAVLMKAGG
jgi:hypothetical protein